MKRNDLIATIVGIVVGVLFLGYLITLGCEYQTRVNQQDYEKRMKEYELMDPTP